MALSHVLQQYNDLLCLCNFLRTAFLGGGYTRWYLLHQAHSHQQTKFHKSAAKHENRETLRTHPKHPLQPLQYGVPIDKNPYQVEPIALILLCLVTFSLLANFIYY